MLRRRRALVADRLTTPLEPDVSGASRRVDGRSRAIGAAGIGVKAVGAFALGAIAVGAVAVGALAIGRLAVGRARVRRLEIDELVVRRLHIIDEYELPHRPDQET